jgi:type 1 glutamine amidotransferase
MSRRTALATIAIISLCASLTPAAEPKRLLLLGDAGSHKPGAHEHMPGLRVLAKCLKDVPGLEVSLHQTAAKWPEGPALLRKADGIVMFLDEGSRWEQQDADRQAALEDLKKRGGGVVAVHWAIGGKDARYIPFHLALVGACHGGPDRKYTHADTRVTVVAADHPVTRGIGDFELEDEYYYQLKRAKRGKVTALLEAEIEGRPEMCAWAFERPDGGRSFGTCTMHFHANWGRVECRRLIAQGVLWTLKLPVPEEGLGVEIDEDDLTLE